ncbi:MAG: hypothetical protein Q9182_001802 [Xanthomendoza sp. 2 TL-2023]
MSERTPQKNSAAGPSANTQGSSLGSSRPYTVVNTPRPFLTSEQAARQHQTTQPAQPSSSTSQVLQANRVIAQNTLNDFNDSDLQEVLYRRYHNVDPRGRPSLDEVLDRIVNVINVVGPRGLPPREAIMLLAQAGWNSAMAIQRYIEIYRRPQVAQEIQRVVNPPPEKSIDDDGDDEKQVPAGVKTWTIVDPGDPSCQVRAVYHHQIRRYLIQRDQRRYGEYRYKRTRGDVFEDQTASHPDQLQWGFDKQTHMPSILFRYKPDGYFDPEYDWAYMRWRGHVVVDIDQTPLRDYRHFPSTLASECEPGLLEALLRLDSRVRLQDLAARQYTKKVVHLPTSGQFKARDNKLSQRIRRFREKNALITWKDARSGNDAYRQWMDNHLPPNFMANNTTRGLPELSVGQIQEIKEQAAGKLNKPAKTERPRKPGGNLADFLLELERLENLDMVQIEEEWRASDTASESAKTHSGPDSRYDVPNNSEEEAELHDAMFPSIYHYLQITGELPVIIHWQSSYMNILTAINNQLRDWSKRRGVSSVDLVGWGFWTGGISKWDGPKLEASPLANKNTEIERDEGKRAKGSAAGKKRAATAEAEDDVEMGEADEASLYEREVSEEGELQDSEE